MSCSRSTCSLRLRLLLVAAVLSLCSLAARAQSYAEGGVCFVFYGNPGTIDYPWAVTVYLDLEYSSVVQSNANGQYYEIVDGGAQYAYTNKSGVTTLSSSQELEEGPLYINSAIPVDSSGLIFLVAPNTRFPFRSFQLPGVGPVQSFGYITLTNATAGQSSAYVQLGAAFTLDTYSQAWVANGIPGFVNHPIPVSSINALSVDYDACQATINANNGVVTPVTPSPSNTASKFNYSYTISDGATYTVSTNLVVTTTSTPLLFLDQLGNTYQNITTVSGKRVYTYLPTGTSIISTVSGLSAASGTPSQRFYPFAYLQSSHGIYTTSTAPYLDGDGLGFTISPAAPINGYAPGTGSQNSAITVHVAATTTVSEAILTELTYNTAPLFNKQQQTYTL